MRGRKALDLGNQFVKGFGGIGGLLRYKVDFTAGEEDVFERQESGSDSSDDDFM